MGLGWKEVLWWPMGIDVETVLANMDCFWDWAGTNDDVC